jgi:O-methyltransferase
MSRALDRTVGLVRRASGMQSLLEASERQDRALADVVKQLRGLNARVSAVEGGLERDRQKRHDSERASGTLLRQRRPLLGDEAFWRLARRVTDDSRTLLGFDRLYVLWQASRNAAPLGLAAVEVGAFRGGSAFFLGGALRHWSGHEHPLYVFDTFSGHSALDVSESEPHHPAGHFGDTDAGDVARYLSEFDEAEVHQARFPDGGDRLGAARIGLVHLDVDLYAPTLSSLQWLDDRLEPGALVVVDDYGADKCPGVRQAVDEYLSTAGPGYQVWDVDSEQIVLVHR